MQVNTKRWSLVHKTKNTVRRSFTTRAAARSAKRSTERIFDSLQGLYVR